MHRNYVKLTRAFLATVILGSCSTINQQYLGIRCFSLRYHDYARQNTSTSVGLYHNSIGLDTGPMSALRLTGFIPADAVLGFCWK